MVKYIPSEQIDLVKENRTSYNPNQQLLLDTLTAFLTAQSTLNEKDVTDLIQYSEGVGAPDFASFLNELISERDPSNAHIPIETTEKHFTATDFADQCGVSVQLVRRECDRGNISAKRGKKNSWLISEKEFNNPLCKRWLQNKQTMWSQMEDSREVLQDNQKLISDLKKVEEKRKE